MHPAFSVIFFTVSTGAGYGLLVCLATLSLTEPLHGAAVLPGPSLSGGIIGLALVTAGLMSSTFHLGHPERAWRAFTQWCSSWLSREGVLAVLTYIPAVLLTLTWVGGEPGGPGAVAAAVGTVALALATVASTGMIYASLQPVPDWHNGWVVPIYLAFALASGALLAAAVLSSAGATTATPLWLAMLLLAIAWGLKAGYWRYIDRRASRSTAESATGLGRFGRVTSLEAPHTAENWLLNEMGFVIARKHARRLRRIALAAGFVVPASAAVAAALATGWLRAALAVLAATSALAGILVERWLFFAEARHAVTLYYGAREV